MNGKPSISPSDLLLQSPPHSFFFFFQWNHSLNFWVRFTSTDLLVVLVHVLRQGRMMEKEEGGGNREWGPPGRDIISVTCFFSFPPAFFFPSFHSFRSFNLRPQRTSTWPGYLADSENNKKDSVGLTSICSSQGREWERKTQSRHKEDNVWFSNYILGHFCLGLLLVCLSFVISFLSFSSFSLLLSARPAEVFKRMTSSVLKLNQSSLDKTSLYKSFHGS